MTPPVDSTNFESNAQETDQQEDIFETPAFMLAWSDKQKADFAFHLLTSLPPYHVAKVVDRISPYLHRNLLSQFPYEISVYILSFLDVHSLIQASHVSRGWHALCEEQSLWRNLFEQKGWKYDKQEMNEYLSNSSKQEDYNAGSSSILTTTSGGGNNNKTISPVPIMRTSTPLIGKNKWSRIYNLRSNTKSLYRKPRIEQRDAESEKYHYDSHSDTRIVNWQRLYRNRYMIERRWISGSCITKKFPEQDASTPETDLHTEGIYTIQFDKEKVVTGSRDHTIKIWDAVTGKLKQTLRGHTASVLCLQYDQHTIVSGSSDATLLVTDMETFQIKHKLEGHQDSVLSLKLITEKDQVVSCSKDRCLRIWDKQTGKCLKILTGHAAPVNAVQYKDTRIVSGSGDRTIKIWDLTTGDCLKTLKAHVRGVACLEFDGRNIVSGSSDQTIKVWNGSTGDCIYTLVGHTELVRTLQLDADRIISGCYNGHLKFWSLSEGRMIRDLGQAIDGRILNVKFDLSKLYCCSNLTRLVIYDFAQDINTKFLL